MFNQIKAARPAEKAELNRHNAMSWFVPPLVVPALLATLILLAIAYQAYF